MRISDWSSDVCSSDLPPFVLGEAASEFAGQEKLLTIVDVGIDVVGIDGERGFEGIAGTRRVAQQIETDTQIVPRIGMSRYGRENDIEDVDGGLRPSEPQQRPSEIVARRHEAGIVEQRLAEKGRSVPVTPVIEEKQAAVIVCLRVARIGGQRALERASGVKIGRASCRVRVVQYV